MAIKRSNKILVGRSEICQYAGFGMGVFDSLLKMRIPVRKIFGAWRAHCDNIDEWFRLITLVQGPQIDMSKEDDADTNDIDQNQAEKA
jgi:hypothetical protein